MVTSRDSSQSIDLDNNNLKQVLNFHFLIDQEERCCLR
jgi:hypothetical protein